VTVPIPHTIERMRRSKRRAPRKSDEGLHVSPAEHRSVYAASVHSIPEAVLAERDARLALDPRDLTAAFCGDPLPGYSALERGRR